MELKYDIYKLHNSQGTGEERQYVRIIQHEPMSEKALQERIQNRCSLTKGDVAAGIFGRSPILYPRNWLLLPVGKLGDARE